ncbi:MAG: hypothetical protein ATN32_03045, partial [Candidatus Epulonipiscium fishelsonii]
MKNKKFISYVVATVVAGSAILPGITYANSELINRDVIEVVKKNTYETTEDTTTKDTPETTEDTTTENTYETTEDTATKDTYETIEDTITKNTYETTEDTTTKNTYETIENTTTKDTLETTEDTTTKNTYETTEDTTTKNTYETTEDTTTKDTPKTTGKFEFELSANVYDYGEAIDRINISVESLIDAGIINPQVDATSLSPGTFKVYAKMLDKKENNEEFLHIERNINEILVSDDSSEITLLLETKNGGQGQSTLNYDDSVSRNFSIDCTYEIDQVEDFKLISGDIINEETTYTQNAIMTNEETELFNESTFMDEINTFNYQHYIPKNADDGNKHPLVIWFHGNGEGGYEDIQNNTSQLKANRGAMGFVTDEAQDIFGGAYVIAPQVPDTWYYSHDKGYLETMKNLIDKYCQENNVDPNRIYIYGASAGGYMTTKMAIEYPDMFAAVVPICPAINIAPKSGGLKTSK